MLSKVYPYNIYRIVKFTDGLEGSPRGLFFISEKNSAQIKKRCPWEGGGICIPITYERSGQDARL